ncbi:MAG TPA: hypothetical protein VFV87_17215 [Pirellulaceae bacterium]|nr:hypothetical protein [Pirellulaceae bacterium]
MAEPSTDQRSPARRALDEEIAAEAPLSHPQLPLQAAPAPMEAHLAQLRRPVAISGIVQNGAVYPVDPSIRLPEHSRVIIVAAE